MLVYIITQYRPFIIIIDCENAPVNYTVSLVIENEKHVRMKARIGGMTNQQPNLEVEA